MQRLRYALNPRGMAFWLMWGAVGGAFELVTSLSGHVELTLSYQVWTLAGGSPWWVRDLFIGACGLAATSLTVHFFGRFTSNRP